MESYANVDKSGGDGDLRSRSGPKGTVGIGSDDGRIEVVIAAVVRRTSHGPEVLLTRRSGQVHLAGSWELPGGKVAVGETLDHAIRRELREEIGVVPGVLEEVGENAYDYPDRKIHLHAFVGWLEDDASVRPPGIVDYRWISATDLAQAGLPPANAPLSERICSHLSDIQGDTN